MKQSNLLSTHFIETTTTGVHGAPNFTIPEGFLTVETQDGRDIIPYAGMATSWYHMSKANDINNLFLASRMWGLTVTDVRTSIVFGTQTEETRMDPLLDTRFNFDFYFGVVANRFCAQALAGFPITVYGKGEQKKPMITLDDAIRSLVRTVELPADGGFHVYNQATMLISPKILPIQLKKRGAGKGSKWTSGHCPTRGKKTKPIRCGWFKEMLLPGRPSSLQDEINRIIRDLKPYRHTLRTYSDRFMNA
ncbi:hypothetical protein JQC72_08200 [Polycladomyces sp. WAk]|uniref:LAGLIDADG endonuclease n=1 Tax=Polycladomyces zharkentensis TaxID=2807616 RepID=A0ABS2WJ18_9BACL|nr:hypothetical protein [Polycladomyces sp. WAk]MBN2909506.1 hypothetical protein [Polycladomyces sp. WAk]